MQIESDEPEKYKIGSMGADHDWKMKILKLENALTGDWGEKKEEEEI